MLNAIDTAPAIVSLSRVHSRMRPGTTGEGWAALHDISFSLRRGEILTLLGAGTGGGAGGNATVLALVAGFARLGSGQIKLGGRMLDETPTHRRDIGMVAKRLCLFPHLDVAGHAGFAPGTRPAEVDAILRRLDLQAFARRRPHSLSPEIQFRVALARALARRPKLLLLQDPLGGLPPAAGASTKALLRAIVAETGLSILHATEDATASYGFSDSIAVIQSGHLRQIGTPQELYDTPHTLAVAQAMGPLNRLAGTVLDVEDDIARIRLSGGAIVEARFLETLAAGDSCVVTLRPERIAVAAVMAAEMGEGAVPARLIETVFDGAQTRLRFSLDTKAGPAPEVLVIRPSGATLPRGNAICLAWQPHHAHAFRTEAALSARAFLAWIVVVVLCVAQFLVLSVPAALLLATGSSLAADRIVETLVPTFAAAVASSLVLGTIAALALWRLRLPVLAVGLIVAPLLVETALLAQGGGVESTAIQLAGHAGQGLAIGTICGLLRLSCVDLGVLRAAACCGVSPLPRSAGW